MNANVRRKIASAFLILGFFVAWEVLYLGLRVSDVILPRPSQIVATLIAQFPAM